MPLDPEAKVLLEQMTAVVRPFDELSVEEARAAIATLSAAAGEGEAVARVENRTIPGPRGEIPVRVYTPQGRAPFPVLVYFHGGGWGIRNLETPDGGGPRLVFQLLVSPVTDTPSANTASYRENAEGYFLTAKMMHWFWNHYCGKNPDLSDPYLCPLRARDLKRLPPALVITAEFDPLRDEGEAYAARLREAGVPSKLTRYPGMIHGFFGMGALLTKAREATKEAADALRAAFRTA